MLDASRQPSEAAARDRALDGLRALAALGVLVFHSWLYRVGDAPGPRKTLDAHLAFQGSLGLICFFVLSGFLLYRSFARAAMGGRGPVDLKGYAIRRAARIVPAYYACIAGCLLLFAAVGYTEIVPAAGRLPLFALFAENYSMDTLMKIDPVAWTLCVEATFYVLLPLLGLVTFLLGPRRIPHQAGFLGALVAVTIGWNLLVHQNGLGPIASKSLPAYIGHFALGMLVAMWVERRPRALGAGRTAALMALGVALVAANAWWYEVLPSDAALRVLLAKLPAALGFGLVIGAAVAGRGPSVAWLRFRPLAAVGVVSYGIYLWHLPLILIVRQAGALPQAFLPRLALVLALALAFASLSWTLLERPFIRRAAAAGRRRRERGLRPAEAQAAP